MSEPAKDIKSFEMIDPLAPLTDLPPAPTPTPPPAQEAPPASTPPPAVETVENEGPANIKDFTIDSDTLDREPAAPAAPPEKEPKGLRAEIAKQAALVKEKEDRIAAIAKELEEERAKPRPDPAELEALRKERDEIKAERQKDLDARNRANAQDHPEVMAIKRPFLEKVDDFVQTLSLSEGADIGQQFNERLGQMVNQRINLGTPGSEGYNERQQALMEAVGNYGSDNKNAILSMITEGAKTLMAAANKQREVAEDQLGYAYKDRLVRYGTVQRQFDGFAESWGKVDENLLASDPLNPKHIVHKIVTGSEGGKAAAAQVRNLINAAFVPPPPLDPREEAVLGPEAFKARIDTAMGQHEAAKGLVMKSSYDAFMALKILPLREKRIAELEAQLAARHREQPKVETVDAAKSTEELEENSGPRDPRKFTLDLQPA